MQENMGNTLGSLYTCPRGLFRRKWWKLGVTVSNFFNGEIPRIFWKHVVFTAQCKLDAAVLLHSSALLFTTKKITKQFSTSPTTATMINVHGCCYSTQGMAYGYCKVFSIINRMLKIFIRAILLCIIDLSNTHTHIYIFI